MLGQTITKLCSIKKRYVFFCILLTSVPKWYHTSLLWAWVYKDGRYFAGNTSKEPALLSRFRTETANRYIFTEEWQLSWLYFHLLGGCSTLLPVDFLSARRDSRISMARQAWGNGKTHVQLLHVQICTELKETLKRATNCRFYFCPHLVMLLWIYFMASR